MKKKKRKRRRYLKGGGRLKKIEFEAGSKAWASRVKMVIIRSIEFERLVRTQTKSKIIDRSIN